MTDAAGTIVITGVSRGLGRALLEPLISAGHIIAGCARRAEPIQQLRSMFGSPHCFETVDVAQESEVRSWSESILESLGPPDLLINNAALINANAPLWEVPTDEFSKVIDVNIKGIFHVTKAFLPAMIVRATGRDRESQLRLGAECLGGRRAVLRDQMGGRRIDSESRPGAARRHCSRSGQSRHHRHRNAAKLLRLRRKCLPEPRPVVATCAVPFLLSLSQKDNGRPLTV